MTSSFVSWLLQATSVATLVNGVVFLFVDGNDASRRSPTAASGEQVAATLLQNLALLLAFVLPHSLLASHDVKDWLGLTPRTARALQTLVTAASLAALTLYWRVEHDALLWDWVSSQPLVAAVLNVVFAGGVAALVLRLVWVVDAIDADAASSSHPVLVAPAVLLLAAPLMSLSRLLLAASLLLYLLFGNTVRQVDAVHAELAFQLHRRKLEAAEPNEQQQR